MRPKLLIIDEVGYLALDALQASLLFQVICQRYQKEQALVLTSNKPFGEWGQVFGDDAVMASAALDRLLHRATVDQHPGRQLPDARPPQGRGPGRTRPRRREVER